MKIYHVILTGGVGSRLWPLSRKSRPKQYLSIFGGASLFELTIKRNRLLANDLLIVGNRDNFHLSEESLRNLNIQNHTNIVEASPRNTAPAIAFAAFEADAEDVLLITPSDHIIEEGEHYTGAVLKAIELAEKGFLVTFGIRPDRPETGYGYIEHRGDDVVSFREKPNLKEAESFLNEGTFLWNSGMFCFKAGVFLEELKKFCPAVYEKSREAWSRQSGGYLELESSLAIPSISIDYAVMEKSDKIKVVKSVFNWSDMGSFEAIYDYFKNNGHQVDNNGNMQIGTEKFTAFAGLKNCIFVATEDANLVLQKEASQKVRDVYRRLEEHQSHLV